MLQSIDAPAPFCTWLKICLKLNPPVDVSFNMEMHLSEGHSYFGSKSCGQTCLHKFDVFLLFVLNNGVVGEAFTMLILSINHTVLFLLVISNLNFNPVFLFLPFILSVEHIVPDYQHL